MQGCDARPWLRIAIPGGTVGSLREDPWRDDRVTKASSRALPIVIAAALGAMALVGLRVGAGHGVASPARPRMVLRDVGPRLTSNQTSQPLSLVGSGFKPEMKLRLGPPFDRQLPVSVLDDRHAFVRLPPDLELPPDRTEVDVPLALADIADTDVSGQARITLINDRHFPDLVALAVSRDNRTAFVASSTTDRLLAIDLATDQVTEIPTGDGPSALALWIDEAGQEWVAVVHEFSPELHLISVDGPAAKREVLKAPAYATGIAIDGNVAFVAEHARDTVTALDLSRQGDVLWRTGVAPNPRALAVVEDLLGVGSLQAGLVEFLDRRTGHLSRQSAPIPGTPIVGGHTERYSKYVMGGKAPRGFAWSRKLRRLFSSSVGPNIGPNPDRWEISPNAGVGVIDPASGVFLRHLGFGAGVTEGLALDDHRGVLFAADVALGVIRVIDVARLAKSDEDARGAVVQILPIPPPLGFPTARPAVDYGMAGRAGIEMHSGPRSIALSLDRSRLMVVNRFTGTLAVIDVRRAANGRAKLKKQIALANMLSQPARRIGQMLYFADMGRSGMSCDGCHLEGHTEGVLFEKTHPMRIYRASTVRGSRETPPYFTPASTFTLAQTNRLVGDRNRLHNPDLSSSEVDALTLYVQGIPTLPNPFVGPDGSPVEVLELPDGNRGRPRSGMALFEQKGGCAECHPAPLFTTDQDPSTRGRYLKIGTPVALPIRLAMQDLLDRGFAPPSLLGAWDIFPMLTSGAAGLEAQPDARLTVSTRFPLRAVVEMYGKSPHGNTSAMTAEERNDLIAYLLSL